MVTRGPGPLPGEGVVDDGAPVVLEPTATPSTGGIGGQLLRGGSWNSLALVAPVLVNIVMTPYLIAGIGLARFGLYILLLTVSDVLASFDGGLYRSAQRYVAVYTGNGDRRARTRLLCTLLLGVTGLGVVLGTVLYMLAAPLLQLFRVPQDLVAEGTFLLSTLGAVIGISLWRSTMVAVLNGVHRFALTSVVTIVQYAAYSVGVVLTLRADQGLRGLAITLLLSSALSALLLLGPVLRMLQPSALGLLPRADLREFLGFTGRTQLVGLSEFMNLQSQSLVIGAFLGVRSVGLYSAGANFASQLRRLSTSVLGPAASALGQTFGERGLEAALSDFARLQRLWVQAVTGYMAVAAGAAYVAVTSWLGPEFRLSGVVAVVLMLGFMVRLWTSMLTIFCQTVGRPDLDARYSVVTLAATLGLSLAFVAPLGVVGVVVGTSLAQVIGCGYLLRLVRRRLSHALASPVSQVPWAAGTLAGGVTALLELLVAPLLPQGPLGLLGAGLAAVPGLGLFAVLVLGPRRAWHGLAVLKNSVGKRSGRSPSTGAAELPRPATRSSRA